ncbi:hypothetical protein Bbelb_050300 [Branchiostoma belcheri]|nr:hypothetical protein Bbelb_050300 [Branchiostoma belcheri]
MRPSRSFVVSHCLLSLSSRFLIRRLLSLLYFVGYLLKRDLTFELEEPCTPAAYVQRVREERDRLVGQCQEAEGYLNYWNLPAHVLEQVRMAVGKSKLITSHAKSPLARFEELCREAMMLGGNKPLGWDPGYRLSLMLAYDGNPTAFGDGADEDLVRYDNRVTVYKSKEKRADVFWAAQARGVGRQLV